MSQPFGARTVRSNTCLLVECPGWSVTVTREVKPLCTDFITLLETVAIRHRMWPTLPDFGPVSHKPAEEALQTTGLKRCNIHTLTTPHRVLNRKDKDWVVSKLSYYSRLWLWEVCASRQTLRKRSAVCHEVAILLSSQWYIFQFVWFEKFKRKIRLAYIAI